MQTGAAMARLGIEELQQYAEDVKKASGEIYTLFKSKIEDAARGNTDEAWWDDVCEKGVAIQQKYENTYARSYAIKYVVDCLTELQSLARGEFQTMYPYTYHSKPWSLEDVTNLLNNPPTDERVEVRYKTDDGRAARVQITPEKRVKAVLD